MTSYYRDRRVLVLGGLGYIGSNLTAALADAGARTTIVTPARDRHRARAASLEARGAAIVEADIRDAAAMRAAVRDQEVVFHLAGRSGAVRSVEDPAGDFDVNCGGSLALLEAMRAEESAARLVFSGSRLAYGRPAAIPVAESQPLAPRCPHGLHKAAVEQYLAIYARLYGLRATTLRITNPYGPGQPRDRQAYGVINFLIHRALAGETLPIYGDGAQLRDYIYIGDVVSAMLASGADPRPCCRVYNVGSGAGISMMDAARLIVAVAGSGRVETQPWPGVAREIDSGDFVADVSRIASELDWRPTVTIEDGLRRTVAAHLAQTTA